MGTPHHQTEEFGRSQVLEINFCTSLYTHYTTIIQLCNLTASSKFPGFPVLWLSSRFLGLGEKSDARLPDHEIETQQPLLFGVIIPEFFAFIVFPHQAHPSIEHGLLGKKKLYIDYVPNYKLPV